MTELRWILTGFAIVLLAAIYLWGRRTSAAVQDQHVDERGKPEPAVLGDEDGLYGLDAAPEQTSVVDREEFSAHVVDTPLTFDESLQRPRTPHDDALIASRERENLNDTWRGRMEPTVFDPGITEELPVESTAARAASADAPTLSSGDTPSPRRIERRKILALRLAASPHRLDGARLLEVLESESMQHGKYDVFHRLHEDGISIFSVASMVEPGTFEPEKMPEVQYPGITMFAQLPGPVPGMHALNELVACARRLQQALGGTLQDDRGVPLTVHRIERMRQEVREFERPSAPGARGNVLP